MRRRTVSRAATLGLAGFLGLFLVTGQASGVSSPLLVVETGCQRPLGSDFMNDLSYDANAGKCVVGSGGCF